MVSWPLKRGGLRLAPGSVERGSESICRGPTPSPTDKAALASGALGTNVATNSYVSSSQQLSRGSLLAPVPRTDALAAPNCLTNLEPVDFQTSARHSEARLRPPSPRLCQFRYNPEFADQVPKQLIENKGDQAVFVLQLEKVG
jgi:hypothetical protein